ncbi:transglycosylase SLT domain-containing protein [Microvirga flavescens]|uniref:transglycosylase SLT domain-containing protein n=1 Tax=Microvirga flavescens TaxID=2249811 RepID=UPI0013007BB0|nr:transglycosylase SLT domain-containing protein [Microvirga flavescens]
MTLQHLLRAAVVACLGAIAVILATQARAEGGDGSSLVSPSEFQEANQAPVAEEVAEEKPATPAKPTKQVATTKAKKAGEETDEEQDSAAAKEPQASSEKTAKGAKPAYKDVEQTSNTNTAHKIAAEADGTEAAKLPKGAVLDAQRANAVRPLIQRYASEHKLPFALADAVVRLESRYNPAARNGGNIGLTQINALTARSLGYDGPASGLHDAETNLRYGLKYLAMAYRLANGDTCGTILRYQFGHRAETMTGASQKYCTKVKAILAASR